MKRLSILLLVSIFTVSGTSQAATIVISQPDFIRLEDYQPTGFGQSFTASGNYSIGAINLYVSSSFGGSDITLRLYDFNSSTSTLGGVVRGSGVLMESTLSSAGAWKSVALEVPFKVSPGVTYAFTIIAKDPGGSATGWNNYGVSATDVYSGGNRLSLGSGGSVTKQTTDLSFQVVVVPEPGISALLAAAVMIGATRRTRR